MTDRLQEHETWQCEISRLGVHLLVHLILVHGFISSLIKMRYVKTFHKIGYQSIYGLRRIDVMNLMNDE